MEDYVIRGGRILDPSTGLDLEGNISVKDGKISSIGHHSFLGHQQPAAKEELGVSVVATGEPPAAGLRNVERDPAKEELGVSGCVVEAGQPTAREEVNVAGCLVVPGLVDIHTHVYQHATTLGVNPDTACLARGVTTVVDGGSAGAMTLMGLRKFICETSSCRVLAWLHVACHGLAGAGCSGPDFGPGGESDHINAIKVDLCEKTVEANRDLVIGIKVRLDRNITDGGNIEEKVFRRALEVAGSKRVPLMVHHTNSSLSFETVLGQLRKGDVYTHCFSENAGPNCGTMVEGGRVREAFHEARKRGVLFDVGHGQGSFDWRVAETAVGGGFWPDIISTDLHSGNVDGAAKDLMFVMSKFYHLGMNVEDIIRAITETPSKAVGREGEIGRLEVGRTADITVVKIEDFEEDVVDCGGETRRLKKRFVPKAVWRQGKRYDILDNSVAK